MEGPTLSGREVLVTGGAGFIGSHIADALVADNEVRVLDDLSTGSREWVPDGAELVVGDVCDGEVVERAMAGVDVVFHEAANVSVERSVEAPVDSHAVNVDATVGVLERARQVDARVVLASSAAVYGHPESVPVAERDPTLPVSPYGLEKRSIDRYAELYADLYGLEAVPLRYFNAYGPRQHGPYSGVISAFLDQARAGEPLTVHGDGLQTRDFVHVRDVVQANLRAATTGAVGEPINVGTGESMTILELARTIADLVPGEHRIVHDEPREGDVRYSEADISTARARLGYEPTTSVPEGLRELVASRG